MNKYGIFLLITLPLAAMQLERPTSTQPSSTCGRISVAESCSTDSEIAETLLQLCGSMHSIIPTIISPTPTSVIQENITSTEGPARKKRCSRDERPFKCRIGNCKRSYMIESHRDKHERMHGFNTFICEECGKNFKIESEYKEHMHIHGSYPTLACKHCHALFYTQSARRYHILKIHPGESAKKPNPHGIIYQSMHRLKDRTYTPALPE